MDELFVTNKMASNTQEYTEESVLQDIKELSNWMRWGEEDQLGSYFCLKTALRTRTDHTGLRFYAYAHLRTRTRTRTLYKLRTHHPHVTGHVHAASF